jgi:hypothetical protein
MAFLLRVKVGNSMANGAVARKKKEQKRNNGAV